MPQWTLTASMQLLVVTARLIHWLSCMMYENVTGRRDTRTAKSKETSEYTRMRKRSLEVVCILHCFISLVYLLIAVLVFLHPVTFHDFNFLLSIFYLGK